MLLGQVKNGSLLVPRVVDRDLVAYLFAELVVLALDTGVAGASRGVVSLLLDEALHELVQLGDSGLALPVVVVMGGCVKLLRCLSQHLACSLRRYHC